MTRKILRHVTKRQNKNKKIFNGQFNGKLIKRSKNLGVEAVKKAKFDNFKNKFEVLKSNPNETCTQLLLEQKQC